MALTPLSCTIVCDRKDTERRVRLTLNKRTCTAYLESSLYSKDEGHLGSQTTVCTFAELALALASAIPCGEGANEHLIQLEECASTRSRKRARTKKLSEWKSFPTEWIRRVEDALGVYVEESVAA